jgi:molybdopterin-containing oxidoreductase family membrane subunit
MVQFRDYDSRSREEIEKPILRPIISTRKSSYAFIIVLLVIIGIGIYAYYFQLKEGLTVTGLTDTIFWGVYVVNLIFFLGISYGGTLISGILRITGSEWRRPITRMAEAITVCSLLIAVPMILVDIGRLERSYYILFYSRLQSPLIWDTLSITTYLAGSVLYLYLSLIPDIALCRDKLTDVSSFKKKIYRWLSLGWRGTEEQKKYLERGLFVMPLILIPIAISAHTALAWLFGTATRVGWHSTIFGPYFVLAAIFSGVAMIIIIMAIIRRYYNLEEYIKPVHFKHLGYFLLVLNLGYIYFTISDFLTSGYAGQTLELEWLNSMFSGDYFIFFWIFVIGGLLVPAFLIIFPKTRTIKGIVLAAILVVIALWIKRYLIVVATLAIPLISGPAGIYTPTWVEWAITAAGIAAISLLFIIFSKLFPIVSIWEIREGAEKENERWRKKQGESPNQ